MTYYYYQEDAKKGDGSSSLPWNSSQVDNVRAALNPGDTLCLRSRGDKEPTQAQSFLYRSGTEDNFITIISDLNDKVVIKRTTNEDSAFDLSQDYCRIEGISLKIEVAAHEGRKPNRYSDIKVTGSNCQIKRVSIIGDKDKYIDHRTKTRVYETGITVEGDDCLLEDVTARYISHTALTKKRGKDAKRLHARFCRFEDIAWHVVHWCTGEPGNDQDAGDLIEWSTLAGSLGSDGIQTDSADMDRFGLIVRNVLFDRNAENHIDAKGGDRILVEGCFAARAYDDNDGPFSDIPARGGAQAFVRGARNMLGHVIYRNNVLLDNVGGISLYSDAYPQCAYNNLIWYNRNNESPYGKLTPFPNSGAYAGVQTRGDLPYLRNNIIAGHIENPGDANPSAEVVDLSDSLKNSARCDYNIYWRHEGKPVFSVGNGASRRDIDFNAWQSRGVDAHSQVADPKIIKLPVNAKGDDAKSYNYGYQKGSPANGSGGPLTHARVAGTDETRVSVFCAWFFCDGFGVSRKNFVEWVMIGNQLPVAVRDIDYNNNELILAEPRTWKEGDGVVASFYNEKKGSYHKGLVNWLGAGAGRADTGIFDMQDGVPEPEPEPEPSKPFKLKVTPRTLSVDVTWPAVEGAKVYHISDGTDKPQITTLTGVRLKTTKQLYTINVTAIDVNGKVLTTSPSVTCTVHSETK